MIPVYLYFEKVHFVALGNVQAHRFQDLIDLFTKDDSAVFGGTYDMVNQDRDIISFVYKLTHANYLIELPPTIQYSAASREELDPSFC